MQKTKTLIASLAFSVSVLSALAQRSPDNVKHENHYKVDNVSTDELTIEFENAQSQQEFSMVKLKITNKTNDYILFKSQEVVFKLEHGDYKSKGSLLAAEDILIEPKATETKTLKVTGDKKFHVDKYKMELNGFYKIAANGTTAEAPDFKLPASTNDFTAGPFKVTLEKQKQQTDETSAQFTCVYQGNEVGILNPSKLMVKIKDGQTFANDNRKEKTVLLMPSESKKFKAEFHIPGKIMDMQFATMFIVWNNTFSESKMESIKLKTADFTLDPDLTLLKNK